jgi:hypothetical protein
MELDSFHPFGIKNCGVASVFGKFVDPWSTSCVPLSRHVAEWVKWLVDVQSAVLQ